MSMACAAVMYTFQHALAPPDSPESVNSSFISQQPHSCHPNQSASQHNYIGLQSSLTAAGCVMAASDIASARCNDVGCCWPLATAQLSGELAMYMVAVSAAAQH